MEAYGDLLQQARKHAGLTRQELATLTERAYNSIWAVEDGRLRPSVDLLDRWLAVCHLSPDMERDIRTAVHMAATDAHGRALYHLASTGPEPGTLLPSHDIPVLEYSRGGDAMDDHALPETRVTEMISIPDDGLTRHGRVVAWRVDNDAMTPELRRDDLLLVYADRPALAGAPALVCVHDGIVCAVWRQSGNTVRLTFTNKKCPARTCPLADIVWAHPVGRIMRTIVE